MSKLEELKKEILADGVIDKDEVATLKKELYADGIIDKDEANFLFELNDAVSGKDNAPEWKDFFIRAICDYLLKDEISPGEIDSDEETWLIDKVSNDGKVDETERELLLTLKAEAKSFPHTLEELLK